MKCKVKDCDWGEYRYGYCTRHYQAWLVPEETIGPKTNSLKLSELEKELERLKELKKLVVGLEGREHFTRLIAETKEEIKDETT